MHMHKMDLNSIAVPPDKEGHSLARFTCWLENWKEVSQRAILLLGVHVAVVCFGHCQLFAHEHEPGEEFSKPGVQQK